VKSDTKTFDTWRDTSEIYARLLMAAKGRNIEAEARLVVVKLRAVEAHGRFMWRAIALSVILAAVWWFTDGAVRTYAGWAAIALVVWSVVSVAALAGYFFDANRTTSAVMSRLNEEGTEPQ
jgi:hypothetical protein